MSASKVVKLSVMAMALVGFLCIGYLAKSLSSTYDGKNTHFTIKPGEGFSSINYRLLKSNLITDARVFHYYTKFQNKMTSFKAGTYKVPTNSSMLDILELLTNGTPVLTKITIPEGKNMFEIGKMLEDKNITTYKDFIEVCRNQDLIKAQGIKAPSLEGYLFPETYKFAPQTPALEVVKTLINQYRKKVQSLDMESGFLNAHEVTILASIVEKETGAKWERPTIAGVYLNRLKKRMRLQADPTTIYGIWENYNGNLRKKHLLEKTPYNTYRINGLPQGPIANPSLAAIKAVLKPKEHNYIFFVSKNDGTHVFTPTYKEHKKAVDYWQKNRRNRKGKSWRDLKQ